MAVGCRRHRTFPLSRNPPGRQCPEALAGSKLESLEAFKEDEFLGGTAEFRCNWLRVEAIRGVRAAEVNLGKLHRRAATQTHMEGPGIARSGRGGGSCGEKLCPGSLPPSQG